MLPGACGQLEFWHPLMACLPAHDQTEILAYPGFGDTPANEHIHDFYPVQHYVSSKIPSKAILVAQFMGVCLQLNKRSLGVHRLHIEPCRDVRGH